MVKIKKPKLDEEGWPVTLPDLKPEDFNHGSWSCGSQCCLVGWVSQSFHGYANAFADKQEGGLSEPALEFLKTFCEISGRDVCMKQPDSFEHKYYNALQASNAFEGRDHAICGMGENKFINEDPLTPEEAAEAWKKSMKKHGYVVSTDIDEATVEPKEKFLSYPPIPRLFNS